MILTVGELRKAMEGLPDETRVAIPSFDTDWDMTYAEGAKAIISDWHTDDAGMPLEQPFVQQVLEIE